MDIVSLLRLLVNGLIEAEAKFFSNPKDLYALEKATKATTDAVAAQFMSVVLSSLDEQIRNSGVRNERYSVQRTRKRTLVSSVGDLTFDCTLYRRKGLAKGGYVSLLPQMLGLDKHERFTEEAEVLLLTEALKTSYAEAARVLPSKQQITKTTVMNKVHGTADEMPLQEPEEIKNAEYLFVEADEDHVAEQHGDQTSAEENGSFISKLVYVYENKSVTEGYTDRKQLINKFYFSGLYPGPEGNTKLWNKVQAYIDSNYDTDKIKRVFVSGDAASWIKNGADHLDKALFCADKYHLMQYINHAAGQLKDEKENVKNELWHLLYSKKKKAKARFNEYTLRMLASAEKTKSIEDLRSYVLGNWAAVRRTLRNKLVNGCSAESHVSHVLSDRLSSRPMGWSQIGADRMSKIRCYERNHGREKMIDLVRYSREKRNCQRTGTDDEMVKKVQVREIIADHYDQAKSYIERIQATIPGLTIRKTVSIREQIHLL